jgi:hypothetical protein
MNQCGAISGCSMNWCCCGYWCCIPKELEYLRGNQCCICGHWVGCGHSWICCANIWCIPKYLRDFSKYKTVGETRGKIYDINIETVEANALLIQMRDSKDLK